MRYLCLDFETNGFPLKGAAFKDWTLPFSSYPVQLSVHAVEDGEVSQLYDTVIRGVTSRAPWAQANIRLSLAEIAAGKPFETMISDLAGLMQEGDVLVAHNASFDLDTCIGRTAMKLKMDTPALRSILAAPRFCTMRCAYCKGAFKKAPKLQELCDHFQVELVNAHDAAADSLALAKCVAEALRRGVMF